MKAKLVIAALVVATIGALVFSLGAFAQNSTTTTSSSNSSACTPVDPEAPVASTSGTSGTSGTTDSSGATAATPAASPTPAASATPAGTAAPSSSGTASTPAATPTTSSAGGTSSSGVTSSSTGTSSTVGEPHETTYCANGFKADVAVPHGDTASVSSANAGSLTGMVAVRGSSAGVIPNTGSSSSTNSSASTSLTAQSLSFAKAMTLSISNSSGAKVNAAHMEICFNDASKSGTIYQWYSTDMWATWYKSSTTPARWVALPTTRTGSMACAQSWLPGTFALSLP